MKKGAGDWTEMLVLGILFEQRVRENEKGNAKFGFLKEDSPYHAYYKQRVRCMTGTVIVYLMWLIFDVSVVGNWDGGVGAWVGWFFWISVCFFLIFFLFPEIVDSGKLDVVVDLMLFCCYESS